MFQLMLFLLCWSAPFAGIVFYFLDKPWVVYVAGVISALYYIYSLISASYEKEGKPAFMLPMYIVAVIVSLILRKKFFLTLCFLHCCLQSLFILFALFLFIISLIQKSRNNTVSVDFAAEKLATQVHHDACDIIRLFRKYDIDQYSKMAIVNYSYRYYVYFLCDFLFKKYSDTQAKQFLSLIAKNFLSHVPSYNFANHELALYQGLSKEDNEVIEGILFAKTFSKYGSKYELTQSFLKCVLLTDDWSISDHTKTFFLDYDDVDFSFIEELNQIIVGWESEPSILSLKIKF